MKPVCKFSLITKTNLVDLTWTWKISTAIFHFPHIEWKCYCLNKAVCGVSLTWILGIHVCLCVRGESQQWLHLRLLWWNGGRPPANSVSYQRGGLQRGLPVCLQYEKGKPWRFCNPRRSSEWFFSVGPINNTVQKHISHWPHGVVSVRKPTPIIGYKMTCQQRWRSRGWRSVSVYSEKRQRGSTVRSSAARSLSWWREWVVHTCRITHPKVELSEYVV